MKRPRIADHSSERRLKRERAFGNAATCLVCLAVFLCGTKAGMLYDRMPATEMRAWLDAVAAPLSAVLVSLALLLWAVTDSRSAALRLDWHGVAGLTAVILVAWSALRVIGTPNLLSGLVALGLLALAVGIAVIVGAASRSPWVLASVLLGLLAVGLLLSVIGLREYLMEWRVGNPGWRVFAGFAVPNFLAGLFVTVLPVSAALFLSVRDRLSTLAVGFLLVLQTLTMLLTQSRLGVAALVIGGIAFLAGAVWSGALKGTVARRAWVLSVVIVAAGIVGAGPVVRRLQASKDQSYSARFRVMTWQGARRIVTERPLLGTGTGSFDTVYPRYSIVGYTQHAHNSFLQWACDTGLPGLIFLVLGIVAACIVGMSALRAPLREDWPLGDERLLTAGLLAGVVGAMAHNVFDSDLYVPANAVVLAATCGSLVALGRRASIAGGHSAKGRSLIIPRVLWAPLTAIVGLTLLVGAGRLFLARTRTVSAANALASQDVIGALDAFGSAARLNPLDPEPHLAMAAIHDRLNEADPARAELLRAVRVAPGGKTYYRLGRYLISAGEPAEAVKYLEKAREADPHRLRALLALADAYRASGRSEDADRVYREMIVLHQGPVGQIRAVPEVPDWEYGIAYAAIAETRINSRHHAEAVPMLQSAENVLGELWRVRNDTLVRLRVPEEAMREAVARYEWVLTQLPPCLRRTGANREADEAQRRLQEFREEHARETGAASGETP